MQRDNRKIPAAEIKKNADFLFFLTINTIAMLKIKTANPISIPRTNRDTPDLDHLELAVRIN